MSCMLLALFHYNFRCLLSFCPFLRSLYTHYIWTIVRNQMHACMVKYSICHTYRSPALCPLPSFAPWTISVSCQRLLECIKLFVIFVIWLLLLITLMTLLQCLSFAVPGSTVTFLATAPICHLLSHKILEWSGLRAHSVVLSWNQWAAMDYAQTFRPTQLLQRSRS